jgi:hypothetical protein
MPQGHSKKGQPVDVAVDGLVDAPRALETGYPSSVAPLQSRMRFAGWMHVSGCDVAMGLPSGATIRLRCR